MQTPFLQQIFPAGHAAVPSLLCVSNTKQLQQMAPNQEASQYGKKGNGILLLMHPKWHSILRNDLKMSRCYNKDRLKMQIEQKEETTVAAGKGRGQCPFSHPEKGNKKATTFAATWLRRRLWPDIHPPQLQLSSELENQPDLPALYQQHQRLQLCLLLDPPQRHLLS